MDSHLFLTTKEAETLYRYAKDLPIVDYHCHLSPKEIYEDRPFENLAQLWLGHDHYKWRLMRQFGIPEEKVTGDAPDFEKFCAYGECIGLAAGNPLYHWTMMELSEYFGVEEPLNRHTAPEIWEKTCQVIREKALSPRKLMTGSRVEKIATTDDPAEELTYHKLLKEDDSFPIEVTPTFRTDKLVNIKAADYPEYLHKLSRTSGVGIRDFDSFLQAIQKRMDDFVAMGCRFSDVGIEDFPGLSGTREQAKRAFLAAKEGKAVEKQEYEAFLFYIYRFLAGEYRKRNMTMQLHLAVTRNANRPMFTALGPDCGGDCVGEPIPVSRMIALFNAVLEDGGLPDTILYTLNPAMYMTMATAAGSFRNLHLGAAWWFNDHKAGIEEQLRLCAQCGHLAAFPGMLTDSRSFLSYARHDYFRRIFCNLLGEWVNKGEYPDMESAKEVVRRVCYQNSADRMK